MSPYLKRLGPPTSKQPSTASSNAGLRRRAAVAVSLLSFKFQSVQALLVLCIQLLVLTISKSVQGAERGRSNVAAT